MILIDFLFLILSFINRRKNTLELIINYYSQIMHIIILYTVKWS